LLDNIDSALRIRRIHREKHRRPQPGPSDFYWLGDSLIDGCQPKVVAFG